MNKNIKKLIILLVTLVLVAGMTGCGGKKYKVDYHGAKSLFKGAKNEYAAGATVKLLFDMVATDTNYTFYVDGKTFNADWNDKKHAYVIEFKMPDHDIEVYYDSYNSMVEYIYEEDMTYTCITMDEAQEIFEAPGDYVIVDVRRADEFVGGHIPGAINIANESIDNTEPSELPDKDQEIYIYCRSGNRSKQASEKLAAMGYKNIIEFGGIIDWNGEIEK